MAVADAVVAEAAVVVGFAAAPKSCLKRARLARTLGAHAWHSDRHLHPQILIQLLHHVHVRSGLHLRIGGGATLLLLQTSLLLLPMMANGKHVQAKQITFWKKIIQIYSKTNLFFCCAHPGLLHVISGGGRRAAAATTTSTSIRSPRQVGRGIHNFSSRARRIVGDAVPFAPLVDAFTDGTTCDCCFTTPRVQNREGLDGMEESINFMYAKNKPKPKQTTSNFMLTQR